MPPKKKRTSPEDQAQFLADLRKDKAPRQQGYREQALKLFPHVCGRCGREFAGKTLRELTVHHIDHDHMNNPADGSNWEMLCLFCHDHEHEAHAQRGEYEGPTTSSRKEDLLDHRPFEGLGDLFGSEGDDSSSK